jgi:putative transcriptional regulator
MSIFHHPDDSTLLSYAAGSLSEAFEILVSCHLQNCPVCCERIGEAEILAGSLLSAVQPKPVGRREQFMAMLDNVGDNIHPIETALNECDTLYRSPLPKTLQQCLEQGPEKLAWQSLVPGVQQIKLEDVEGNLKLLKIAADTSIPTHTHQGSELTLILQGNYSDELGEFNPGDVADLSPEHQHQPVTDKNHACICLVATDAPLKFQGLLPRLVQPFIDF